MHRLPRAFPSRFSRLFARPGEVLCRFPLRQYPRPTSRAVSQQRYLPTGEPVRFQAVRFKRARFFSARRFLTYIVYTSAIIGYFVVVLRFFEVTVEIIDEEEFEESRQPTEDQTESGDVEDDEELFYAEEDSFFIPLTWSKKMPRTYYRGSDPEWQEFLKISQDKPRHQRIQEELVQQVFASSVRHPLISRQLGKDHTVGKYWLDISFPDGPPQEYERSGIEIGDGFVAWSKQKVSQENQWRLIRAIWPSAAAGGMWAAVSTLMGIQYRRVKQALGWEKIDPQSPEERYRQLVEILGKHKQSRQGKGDAINVESEPNANTRNAVDSGNASTSATPQKRLPWHVPMPLPIKPQSSDEMNTSNDLPIARHVFNHTLSKMWQPKKADPPRGACVVQGLVEVRGTRGRMLLDVQGAYDPRQAKYVQINVGVRNYKRWNQSPRGGH